MKPLHRGGDGLLGLVWRNLVPPKPSIGISTPLFGATDGTLGTR